MDDSPAHLHNLLHEYLLGWLDQDDGLDDSFESCSSIPLEAFPAVKVFEYDLPHPSYRGERVHGAQRCEDSLTIERLKAVLPLENMAIVSVHTCLCQLSINRPMHLHTCT